MTRFLASSVCLTAVLALGLGCSSDDKPGPTDGGKGGGGGEHQEAAGPPAPTFTNVWKKVILANGCQQIQCHGPAAGGGLLMTSKQGAYDDLVGKPAAGLCVDGGAAGVACGCGTSGKTRVVKGKPDESLLVEKLKGSPSCGDRMPPNEEPIDDPLIDLVERWIAADAPND